jgi:hypothetical protein
MLTVVGVFQMSAPAYEAVTALKSKGIRSDRITLLVPGDPAAAARQIRTTEAEPPGMGAALGGVVGGTCGASAGIGLGEIAATMIIPGIGPVVAWGILGAVVLGAVSAAGGAAAGDALEKSLDHGLPVDEIYVYEDALRQGRAVVVVLADNAGQASTVRDLLARAGAESIDAAREQWWIGLRDAELEHYTARGLDFARDEPNYRRGFEAAQDPRALGQPYLDSHEHLAEHYPDVYREESFRRGYERGLAMRPLASRASRR